MKAAGHHQSSSYIPLWKQWMETDDYKSYIKNELPIVEAKMAAMDGLTKQQREDIMAKQFQVRWMDAATGKINESTHNSEKSAKDRARDLSMSNSPVQLGEVDGGKLLQQWNFDKGRQQPMNAKKQVSIAPISKKEALQIKTNNEKGASVSKGSKEAKSGQKKPTKEAKEATVGAAKAKTQPLAKPAKPEPKKTGTVRDQFGLREGTVRAKLVDCLLEAKGKALPVATILKASYGAAKEEFKAPLTMCLKGMQQMIDKNKIKLQIVKEKDSKGEMTIALKAK